MNAATRMQIAKVNTAYFDFCNLNLLLHRSPAGNKIRMPMQKATSGWLVAVSVTSFTAACSKQRWLRADRAEHISNRLAGEIDRAADNGGATNKDGSHCWNYNRYRGGEECGDGGSCRSVEVGHLDWCCDGGHEASNGYNWDWSKVSCHSIGTIKNRCRSNHCRSNHRRCNNRGEES